MRVTIPKASAPTRTRPAAANLTVVLLRSSEAVLRRRSNAMPASARQPSRWHRRRASRRRGHRRLRPAPADIGTSVDSATDVAEDAADVLPLHKDLGVFANGVIDGSPHLRQLHQVRPDGHMQLRQYV